jgi:cardiolipin synthase A/B
MMFVFSDPGLLKAVVVAHRCRLIVGSITLAPGSFDSRRELAIGINAPRIIKRMVKVARHDWKHPHHLDLTDKGLLAELKRHNHNIDAEGELAIGGGRKRRNQT